jgi:CheY-like chemotaxis protein
MKGGVVNAMYKKADNLDDKVKDVQLPYFQWKVLFMVSEDITVDDMSTLLEEKTDDIETALEALSTKGLIEPATAKEEADTTTPLEELESSAGEQLAEEETPVEKESDTKPALEESEDTELNLEEMADYDEPEPIEEIKEDDIAASLEEKTEEEQSIETPLEEETTEPEKSEVGEFLEGVNELADSPAPPEVTEEPAPEELQKEEIISEVSQKTIIVIDDSIVIRKMIEIALEEEDFRIVTATTGQEGIAAMEKDEPSLIILDMLLPDMNGIELLKKIKEGKNMPVIMLSGKDSPQLVENAKEVGVDDFLPKPFRDEELVEKVKNLVS